uniref:Uncharacterized protein n=1 Tax=Physcomitrium patens TaxID=3218 RepID=A0A2K1L0R8_PHYPA|nr:hypothetical protein PHYPA_002422 [Physcomitrium patens]
MSLIPRGRKQDWGRSDNDEDASTACDCEAVKLNPEMWSLLRQDIVDSIYARVLYVDFFRLRCVGPGQSAGTMTSCTQFAWKMAE